ncbi:MAG TPA: hypothetical protein VFR11_09315 [Micromonosporaceae bacterium]|jgi:hypothetical protein|nr:hypothetical protein [Micromonosporaceae bacterium]
MTHGRTQVTIELRTSDREDARDFATVAADRATLDGGRLIAWLDGRAIASYPVATVAGLRFAVVGGSVAPVPEPEPAAADTATADAATAETRGTATADTGPAETGPAESEPADQAPASGTGWTYGEDSLLRTLSDQHAGLTMMILKTQRPMDEVIARLKELGIDPTGR